MTTSPSLTGDLIRSVRLERCETLAAFGKALAKVVHGPKSPKGAFSRQYIDRLEKGKAVITPAIAKALNRMMAAMDDADPDIAAATPVTVYATGNVANSLITADAIQCARPGCPVKFVPYHPRQRYHNRRCREQANRAGRPKKGNSHGR